MGPAPDPATNPALFTSDLEDANKKLFLSIFCLLLFEKVQLHHFSKIKSCKEVTNSRNSGFS
jgi:hypothetical protein